MHKGISLVLHNGEVRRITLITFFSSAAEGVFLGALPLAVADRGGGPFAVGLVAASLTIWYLVSIPLGTLVDRLGVGKSLRLAAPLRIPALVIIAGGVMTASHIGVTVMIVGAALYGLFDIVTSTATAALPALVIDESMYDDVFPIVGAVQEAVTLVVGPSAGALLLVSFCWPVTMSRLPSSVTSVRVARLEKASQKRAGSNGIWLDYELSSTIPSFVQLLLHWSVSLCLKRSSR